VFLFADYFRSNEDAECKRGCVEQKFLSNSADERDYKIVKDKEEDRLKATYCLWQKQDGSLPGYPKGDYNILAVFLEGNWTPEEQGTKNTLRKGFGINKASEFAAIMAANSIPAIIACSPNVDESNKRNAGRSHLTDNGTLVRVFFFLDDLIDLTQVCWGNGAYFCLREYLLTQCAPVSLNYVRFVNSLPAEGAVYLQNEDTQRPCMLNRANQVKKGNQYILSGGRVLNLSEYSGNLTGLLAANPKRCEFRVLHSVPTDPETREKLAGLSTSDAEKVRERERERERKNERVRVRVRDLTDHQNRSSTTRPTLLCACWDRTLSRSSTSSSPWTTRSARPARTQSTRGRSARPRRLLPRKLLRLPLPKPLPTLRSPWTWRTRRRRLLPPVSPRTLSLTPRPKLLLPWTLRLRLPPSLPPSERSAPSTRSPQMLVLVRPPKSAALLVRVTAERLKRTLRGRTNQTNQKEPFGEKKKKKL
jgi:hypothetical protein